MQTKFTDIYIKNLRPEDGQYEVFDTKTPGFGLRVSPGGTKSFTLLYRNGQKKKRLKLGKYPDLKLRQARAKAEEALRRIATGDDPQLVKLEERQRYDGFQFSKIVDEYIEKYAKRKTSSSYETGRILRKEFVSHWGRLHLKSIDKGMVNSRIDEIHDENGPSAANHAFAAIRGFFNWCVERDYLVYSPCVGLKAPAKTKSRDRVLSDDELASVWHAAEVMAFPFGPFIQVLMLTGQRRAEVAKLRWQDLDLKKAIWIQRENKADREHHVPLSKQAIAIINGMPRIHDELVFPARGKDTPIAGFSKFKKRLNELSGVPDWGIHDLRRTLATKMAALGISIDVIEIVLNHQSQKLRGVAGIYNRYQYIDEVRDALQEIADCYEAIFQVKHVDKCR